MGNDANNTNFGQFFISYARVDGEKFANYLADRLEENGFPVWMDQRCIPKGADWDWEIDRALRQSAAVLMVATPGATISEQVKGEWLYALNHHIPLFPLIAAECEVPRTLLVRDCIDFRGGYQKAFAQLMQDLEDPMRGLLEHLKEKIAQLESARQSNNDPDVDARYAEKIAELHQVVDLRKSRVRVQQARIRQGLGEEVATAKGADAASDPPLVLTAGRRPLDVTEFFKDRDLVRRQISEVLAAGTPRIVTVIGRGGMGKTAVCCKILRDLEQHHWQHESNKLPQLHGIAYLSTRTGGVTGERLYFDALSLLPEKLQDRLKKVWVRSELSLEEKFSSLLEALDTRPCVMLWDNMEDLLDDAGRLTNAVLNSFLDVFINTPHSCRLLLTSREAVPLAAEVLRHEFRVGLVDGLPEADSMTLLKELDPSGTYGLADASEEQLRRVAKCTFGVPRALEIVAGILANDPFSDIDELAEGFYSHEEVVKKLAKENYRRLDEDAQLVLQAIAVFGRPISRTALDFLLAPFSPGMNVPAILRRLVSTHIVSIDRASKLVSLHPIDREYILSQMPTQGEQSLQAMHAVAAEYYRSIETVELIETKAIEMGQIEPQTRRFHHLCEAGLFNDAATLFLELGHLLVWRGSGEQARQMADRLHKHPLSDEGRSCLLTACISLATVLGPLEDAMTFGDEAIALARKIGSIEVESRAQHQLITAYRYLENNPRALECCAQARTLYHQLGDQERAQDCTRHESLVLTYQGNLHLAHQRAYELMKAAVDDCDKRLEGKAHNVLSAIHYRAGDFAKSIDHCRSALQCWQHPDEDAYAYVLNTMGMAMFRCQKLDDAKSIFIEGRQVGDDVQSPRAAGFCLHNLTIVHCLLGETAEATAVHRDAQDAMDRMGLGAPTRHISSAIEGQQQQNLRGQAEALLQCALLSKENPDLFGIETLHDPIRQLATKAGAHDIVQKAHELAAEVTGTLVPIAAESN